MPLTPKEHKTVDAYMKQMRKLDQLGMQLFYGAITQEEYDDNRERVETHGINT